MQDLLDALVDAEAAAEGEDAQRHHERPEVGLGPVAERVVVVGRARRAAHADEQEDLVGGVGQRVARLGQHRARAREAGGDELEDGDGEVDEQRGDDDAQAAVRARSTRFAILTGGAARPQRARRRHSSSMPSPSVALTATTGRPSARLIFSAAGLALVLGQLVGLGHHRDHRTRRVVSHVVRELGLVEPGAAPRDRRSSTTHASSGPRVRRYCSTNGEPASRARPSRPWRSRSRADRRSAARAVGGAVPALGRDHDAEEVDEPRAARRAEIRAPGPRRCMSACSSVDLPTFERPANAISGGPSSGQPAPALGPVAERRNSASSTRMVVC